MKKIKKLFNIFLRILLPVRNLSKRNKKILFGSSIVIILIMAPIIVYSLLHLTKAEAAWFDDNFSFRQRIDITNSGSAQTDYQVSFTLNTSSLISAGKMRTDCNDIRVTDVSGNLLPHWIEESNPGCNSTTTKIWTKLTSITTTGDTLYVYYGNPQAKNIENPSKIFLFYDTFSGSSIDTNKWTATTSSGTITVSGGKATLSTSTASGNAQIITVNKITSSAYALESKFNVTTSSGSNIRDRFYLNDTAGGSRPSVGNLDYGIFSQATGPQPQVFWAGFTGTSVTTSNEIKNIQSLDGTNFSYSLTDLSSQSTFYSTSSAQASTDFGYVNISATHDPATTGTSQIAIDWIIARKTATTVPTVAAPTNEENGPGPIAYWKFDEGTGTTANDSTPTNAFGTLSGTTIPTWKSRDFCISQKCLFFDGVTSNVSVGTVNSVKSISFWVKPASSSASLLKLATGVDIKATSGVVGQDGFTSPTIYVNGVLNGTFLASTWNYITLTTNTGVTANSITLGKMQLGVLSGFMDEVKLYNYVRTTAQIKADYAKWGNVLGATANQNLSNGLVGYWKMDESGNSAAQDSSGNGFLLSNNNAVSFSTGKFGSAPTFNGSNKYFSASSSITGVQTVSFWVKPASTTDNFINLASGVYINASSGTIQATGMTGAIIYVNGQISSTISSGIWQLITVTQTSGTSTNVFEIGRANGSLAANNTQIDEIRVYNRTLSPSEVDQLYNFAPDPIAYYPFEEGQGTSVNDVSTNGNAGSWNGTGPHWDAGKYGKSGDFITASGDYVSAADTTANSLTGNFTLSAWIKTTSAASQQAIIEKYDNGSLNGYAFRLTSTGNLQAITLDGTSSTTVTGVTTISTSTWVYATAVYDGATLKLYYNGNQDNSGADTRNPTDGSLTLKIGARGNDAGTTFSGNIDEVKIYNYARTPGQIIEDMNASHPLGGSPVGSPVGYWKFNEGYGTVTNNSGSLSTASGVLTSTVWTNDGKFGKALSFDGTASSISIPLIPAFYPTEITSTAWIYPTKAQNGNIVSASVNLGWRYRINAAQTITFFDRGATNAIITTETIPLNQWSYIAVVGNANGLKIYINGHLSTSNTTAYGSPVPAIGNVFIGQSGSSNEYFQGKIDEVKIYNTALSASQIKVDMNHSSSLVLGDFSDTSGLTGGQVGSNSASAIYCVPGDTSTCSSPVGEWNFEEGYSTTVNDSSGNANTGTWSGTPPYWAQGRYGKGGSFDGSDNYVDAGTGSSLSITGSITVSSWFKSTSAAAGNIAAKWDSSSLKSYRLTLNLVTANKVAFRLSADGTANSATVESTSNVNDGKWHLATGVYDGSTVKMYIDGILQASTSYGSGIKANATEHFLIGAESNATPTNFFNGSIDGVRVYNYARTAAQVAWDYSYGDPIGYYKLDECRGNTINNSTGTQSATIVATSTIGTCSTASTLWGGSGGTGQGKVNYAPTLNGTGDYIRAGSDFNFTSSNFSISYWINLASLSTNVGGQGPVPIYKGDFQVNGYYEQISTTGGICFITNQAAANQNSCTPNGTISTGNWYHITTVRNGTSVRIYVNGQDRTTTIGTHTDPASSGDFFNIGRYKSSNILTNGQIDEVKIFNYALTKQQVYTNYNQGSSVRYGPQTGAP